MFHDFESGKRWRFAFLTAGAGHPLALVLVSRFAGASHPFALVLVTRSAV
jgi:hypothetical protein